MAIWTGDDYQIDKVSANTSSSAADSVGIAYLIEIQRLPSEN